MGLPERQRPTYRAALGGALAAGLGSGAVLLLVGLLVAGTASVADLAVHFELIGGLIAIALGIATLVGRGFSIRAPARAPRRAGWQGLAGFGALYGLVAAGCSAPVLLSIVATGASAGLLVPTFAAYAAGLVVFMVLLTVLVAYAKAGVVDRFRRLVRVSGPVSGAVLIVVGAYLVYYWWSAIHPGAIG
jgi:cytochrome c biogenesis protein CcdA